MEPVRLAVVGLRMGQSHIELIRSHPDFVCVGACDLAADKRAETRARFQLGEDQIFSDYETMLDTVAADGVVISTPIQTHVELARIALARNLHVLLEKPLAPNLTNGLQLKAAVDATDRVVQIGYEMRSSPLMRKCREIVASGVLGRVLVLWVRMFRGLGNYNEWRRNRQLGGGQFFDCLVHEINEMQSFAGAPFYRCMAFGAPAGQVGPNAEDVPDTATACVEFENGIRGSIAFSQISKTTNDTYFGIVGDQGRIDGDPWLPEHAGSLELFTEGGLFKTRIVVDGEKASTGHLGFREQYDNFAATIRTGAPNCSDYESALETQRLMTAFNLAMARNEAVFRSELTDNIG